MKSLYESLLDDEEDLIGNTTVTEEDLLKKYIEEHYKIQNNDKLWIKKSRKLVQLNKIIPNNNTETLELPYGYKWDVGPAGKIDIWANKEIKNLKGCPEYVNQLTIWRCNNLVSLEGAPKHVEEDFEVEECHKLKNLKGGPEYVGKMYNVQYNNGLESLEGAPKKCKGFYCSHTGIKSLKGAPQQIEKRFTCNNCMNLTSLEGLPKNFNLEKVGFSALGCKNLSNKAIYTYFNITEEKAKELNIIR